MRADGPRSPESLPDPPEVADVVRDEWLELLVSQARSFVPLHLWQVAALMEGTLSMEAFRLWLIIASHARGKDGRAWPSNARIAALAGGVTARSVQRWVRELQDAGWVDVTRVTRRGPGGPVTERAFVLRKSPKVGGDTACRQATPRVAERHGASPPRDTAGVASSDLLTHHPELHPEELDEMNHPDVGAPRGTQPPIESPDPAASLWSMIQETLAVAGCPVRAAPSVAMQALYALHRTPGHAPDPARVLAALRRDAAGWVQRASDARAAGEPDPWRFTPGLGRWISERRWEVAQAPEPPGPPPTASTPGVSARELARREEVARARREAAQRAGPAWVREGQERGLLDADGKPVRDATPVADAVSALLRRKGPPA